MTMALAMYVTSCWTSNYFDTYTALTIEARNRVCHTRGRGMDLRYTLSRVVSIKVYWEGA